MIKQKLTIIIAILLAFSFLTLASAQQNNYPYNCGYGMMGNYFGSAGSTFAFGFMMVFWVLIIVALILLIAWLIKQLQTKKR